MNKDNRGFTLIELIICVAILAVVIASAFGFMLASSRSYATVTTRLNLQLQSELVMNQLGDYIIDCNGALYYKTGTNSNTLYIINENADGTYTSHVFKYVKADGCINYGKGTATDMGDGTFTCTATAADLLAENVTGFSVTQISSDGVNVTSARVSIAFVKNSATCSGIKTIALRNNPAISVVS